MEAFVVIVMLGIALLVVSPLFALSLLVFFITLLATVFAIAPPVGFGSALAYGTILGIVAARLVFVLRNRFGNQ